MVTFSLNTQRMRSSEIRRLMNLAADPSIISFAGGMPNNDLFPVRVVEELYNGLSLSERQTAFQYGPTGGYPPLLKSLKDYLRSKGLPVDTNDLLITSGAMQAINLLTKVLIDPDDVIIAESPSFIGALAAFNSYGARCIGVPLDNDGIVVEGLKRMLQSVAGTAKMIYLCPNFHNPAGIIYSEERKMAVMELTKKYDICLLEDDPYSELYFDISTKALTRSMKSFASAPSSMCYVGSFAKILGPGMRVGYLFGPKEIIEKCELAKQSADACTSTYTQVLANAFLSEGKLNTYLEYVRPIYKRRCGIMLDALDAYMPEPVTWTRARGGFYIWVTLPQPLDATDLFKKCMEKGAAFVIGSSFDPEGEKNNCFRLAFSHTPEDKIAQGIRIIAEAVQLLL